MLEFCQIYSHSICVADVFLAALLAAVFFCLMYCMQKVCPRVDMYSPLELDEIRLERAQGREGVLAERIDRMKVSAAV